MQCWASAGGDVVAGMSGWIKLEKDLRDDPRFLRMVRAYCNAHVTHERISERHCATLLLGCLAQLWMYADSHIREDDTLDLGADEVDELIGVQGFAALMPSDWLEVVDPHRVKLQDFHAHNGTDAKKKALTAKRVANHRIRNVTQERNDVPASSNAAALPDQTRPDQTRPDQKRVPSEPVELHSTDSPIQRVFDHWRTVHRHPKAVLDAKRRKLIATALKSYDEATLCLSISGYLWSPHHQGQNDTGTVFDAIELLLRDAKHIDAGLRFHAEPPRADQSQLTRKNVAATQDWEPPEAANAAG